jgi:hypothetical protein
MKLWVLVAKGPGFYVALSLHRTLDGAQRKASGERGDDTAELQWETAGDDDWAARIGPGWLYQIYPRTVEE